MLFQQPCGSRLKSQSSGWPGGKETHELASGSYQRKLLWVLTGWRKMVSLVDVELCRVSRSGIRDEMTHRGCLC